MIQRIQTLYLLAVAVLGVLSCVFPFAMVGETAVGYTTWWPFAVLSTVIPLLALADIFLFRRRILQMRLGALTGILLAFQLLTVGLMIYFAQGENTPLRLLWPIVNPPISLILCLLAIRAIGKDEVLVRAADRLR